jgi:hypothetical protein
LTSRSRPVLRNVADGKWIGGSDDLERHLKEPERA